MPAADRRTVRPARQPPPPPDSRPRLADSDAGISYAKADGPWMPWNQVWSAGTLGVQFKTGYYFVTEPDYEPGRDYLASVLSGSVPATVNDGTELDLKCTGQQVAEDVRANFYPNPNTTQPIRDEMTSLGGRPAWVSVFRLHFHAEGLHATSELVGVVLVDVGKPSAAVLYLSIPPAPTRSTTAPWKASSTPSGRCSCFSSARVLANDGTVRKKRRNLAVSYIGGGRAGESGAGWDRARAGFAGETGQFLDRADGK
ncbi:hypothetical protein [Fodinicola feengrottensis]|uniref:hypothetical protein n=1 Tax=Fodinicola feengrottensis TaxID=435914 RepID=UPI002441EF86|nr:hypothetical protein [Fodinicola feengrottensis]